MKSVLLNCLWGRRFKTFAMALARFVHPDGTMHSWLGFCWHSSGSMPVQQAILGAQCRQRRHHRRRWPGSLQRRGNSPPPPSSAGMKRLPQVALTNNSSSGADRHRRSRSDQAMQLRGCQGSGRGPPEEMARGKRPGDRSDLRWGAPLVGCRETALRNW